MRDATKSWPMGVTTYTVVDVSDWHDDSWWSKEQNMLAWLRSLDHDSWFAWERPRGTMVFESQAMAELFVMRWS